MTAEQVKQLLREPLSVVTRSTGAIWVYSDSPVSRSYRMREVMFGADSKVSAVVAEFVFD
jgi:hypothetical protein